jgi:gamma-D-glutamyl-L-lysine dipeptidyl-peptidase
MHYYIKVPSVLMREEPSREARVASEALYAEVVLVKEVRGEWCLIQTPDGYHGWIDHAALIVGKVPSLPLLHVCRRAAHLYHVKDTEWGPIKTLPFGSPLEILDIPDERWLRVLLIDGMECYIQKGDVAPLASFKNKKDLVEFSQQFLGLPYTWGGRSSFGFDCSGFVQMLYRHMGVSLPRDSKDQARDDRFVDVPVDALEAGDLVFFGKTQEKIGHVGMMIGNEAFIHTSSAEQLPFLRVSRLSDHEWSGSPHVKFPFRLSRRLYVDVLS